MRRLISFLLAVGALQAAEQPPASLMITYQCMPADRPALRKAMLDSGLARFQHWQEAGVLRSFLILFSRHVNSGRWDMLALLHFADSTKVDRWSEIEKWWPAGLAKEELSLLTDVRTGMVDLVQQNAGADPPEKPVFVVTPLSFEQPSQALGRLQASLAAQAERWLAGKAVTLSEAFLSRPPGDMAYVVQEFDNEEAFEKSPPLTPPNGAAQGEPVVAEVLLAR
ncbi:MAG TPA: hypothetical protein VHD76_22365 [Bryobacteraceae bacterium]|jgi:hypothetical protein|nr:hypothetical protein [Bryobacteraceae bacterium]